MRTKLIGQGNRLALAETLRRAVSNAELTAWLLAIVRGIDPFAPVDVGQRPILAEPIDWSIRLRALAMLIDRRDGPTSTVVSEVRTIEPTIDYSVLSPVERDQLRSTLSRVLGDGKHSNVAVDQVTDLGPSIVEIDGKVKLVFPQSSKLDHVILEPTGEFVLTSKAGTVYRHGGGDRDLLSRWSRDTDPDRYYHVVRCLYDQIPEQDPTLIK